MKPVTAWKTRCALLFALLPLSVALHTLPLSRNPVSTSRLFSVHHRPWAASLPSTPTFHTYLRFSNGTRLPSHPVYGSIIPLGEYYLTLSFGGQPINVQIDTGSSTIAVPLKECINCRPHDHRLDLSKATGTAGFITCDSPACRRDSCHAIAPCTTCSKKTRACCSAVAPSACGFYLQYADMSGASGALVQANVEIADMKVPLAFGAILRETAQFETTSVDGIFGLAYKSLACNPTCVLPLFDTLVHSGKVKKDIFSLCTSSTGGTLTLGGSDPKFYEGKLHYVPMTHKGTPHFYEISVRNVRVGDRKVKLPHFSDAIVDSGTTVLVVAPKAYAALRAHFLKYYCAVPGLCVGQSTRHSNYPGDVVKGIQNDDNTLSLDTAERAPENSWFGPGYCARLTSSHLKLLPNIVINLDKGVELVLEPEVYMLKYETTSTFGLDRIVYRCLGISYLAGLDVMENNVIIGDTVLQKYFVEYDRENNRVGFAVARNCYDPSTRHVEDGFVVENDGIVPSWVRRILLTAAILAWLFVIMMCAKDARKRRGYTRIQSAEQNS